MSILTLPPLPFASTIAPRETPGSGPLPSLPPHGEPFRSRENPRPQVREPLRHESTPRHPAPPRRTAVEPLPASASTTPSRTAPPASQRPAAEAEDFTDHDLADALRPLVGGALPIADLEGFETLIRAVFRRTLAEHAGGPFDRPDLLHQAAWRIDSLFSSRSYGETVDRRLNRFRIEEIHLLDRRTLGLVSLASTDPVRHADPRKARKTTSRLAATLAGRGTDGALDFELNKQLHALVRPGRHTLLAAVVRGRPDPLAAEDLDFALRRLEDRFEAPLAAGDPLLAELQPLLEECLLIHSPPASIHR